MLIHLEGWAGVDVQFSVNGGVRVAAQWATTPAAQVTSAAGAAPASCPYSRSRV